MPTGEIQNVDLFQSLIQNIISGWEKHKKNLKSHKKTFRFRNSQMVTPSWGWGGVVAPSS